jgi:3'(2'), 5'-bisphosphate nucleotidase
MTDTFDINALVRTAREAGDAILEIYRQDFAVYEKQDASPLTEADLASHRIIVEALRQLTPDIPVLSEEDADIPFGERSQWSSYWLIDPLDGTKEFIKKNDEFTVNIALIREHRPYLGVVHVPATGVTFYGEAGKGAFRMEHGETRQIHATTHAGTPLRVAGSRSHAGSSLQTFLENIGAHEIVSMGSSLKLCLVAEGKADLYPRLGPTSEWDTAAAQAVVEAAGGMVTDTSGSPLLYNTKESLLNPHFLVFGDRSRNWTGYL